MAAIPAIIQINTHKFISSNGQAEGRFFSCYRKNQVTRVKTGMRMNREYPM